MTVCFKIPHQLVPSNLYSSPHDSTLTAEALDSCRASLWHSRQDSSLLTDLHTCPPRGMSVSGHFLLPHATLIPLKTAHGNLSRPSPFRAAWTPSSEPGLKHPGLIKLRVCVWSVCSLRSAAFTKPFHIFSHESYKADRAVNISSIYKWVNWDLKSSNLLKLKQFAQSHSIGTRNAWTRQQFFWF